MTFQRNHGNLASRPCLVIAELGIQLRLPGVEPISLLTAEDGSNCRVGLITDFDGDFGVNYQIMIPVRVGWRTAFGSEI